MADQHYRINVRGRVQGVFFRAAARRCANELGLRGLARNEPDGSVYLEVEGNPDALDRFLTWCREGPPAAEVADVTHSAHPPAGHEGFRVL